MSEHEQGAEQWASRLSIAHEGMWEVFRRRPGLPEEEFLVRFHYSADDLRDYLNALEADNAALRTQLTTAEAKAALADELAGHLRYWLGAGWASTTRGVASHTALDRFDALSRDTGRHEYRPSSDLVGSPCALCRQRPDEHDGLRSEESWNND